MMVQKRVVIDYIVVDDDGKEIYCSNNAGDAIQHAIDLCTE